MYLDKKIKAILMYLGQFSQTRKSLLKMVTSSYLNKTYFYVTNNDLVS